MNSFSRILLNENCKGKTCKNMDNDGPLKNGPSWPAENIYYSTFFFFTKRYTGIAEDILQNIIFFWKKIAWVLKYREKEAWLTCEM